MLILILYVFIIIIIIIIIKIFKKYVGESERAIRQVFSRARASSPCVIFFDELDAICPKRSNDTDVYKYL